MNIYEFVFLVQNTVSITKDSEAQIGSRKYTYANMTKVMEMLRPLLKEHRVVVSWVVEVRNSRNLLTVYLTMVDDHNEQLMTSYVLSERGTQFREDGAELGYWKRMLLLDLLGLNTVEDDEAEMFHEKRTTPTQSKVRF